MDDRAKIREREGRIKGDVREGVAHDSAEKHVTGAALYTDDIPEPKDVLHIFIAMSAVASGRIKRLDLDAVKAAPGVVAVLTARAEGTCSRNRRQALSIRTGAGSSPGWQRA